MTQELQYCWVVTCKNYEFHRERNPFHGHRIPLGKTDEQMPRPDIPQWLVVRCSDCSKEFQYDRSEVLRFQLQLPERFIPHPLFLGSEVGDSECAV